MQFSKRSLILAASAAVFGALPTVRAHGDKDHPGKAAPVKKEQKDWGIAGDLRAVTRTIEVQMLDTMRFVPDRIEVPLGATVRFVNHNAGKVMHEFVIGTSKELEEHAALMVRFPNMEHDEPYMAHVPPGQRAEIVWMFNRPGEFEFACLIAGHFQAGMVGRILVAPAA
ncbi:MAG: cupredoxin family protein [Rubrivivax sp.]|nr:cupredoxin family protein [Rubrivivax sp.]